MSALLKTYLSKFRNAKVEDQALQKEVRALSPVSQPCLPIKREEMMINSEKRKLLHDYYRSHMLFH